MSNDFADHEKRVEEQPEHDKDALRAAFQNGRNFALELLKAKLRAEMFNASEAHEGDSVAAYKLGWNSRAKGIIESLGGNVEDV